MFKLNYMKLHEDEDHYVDDVEARLLEIGVFFFLDKSCIVNIIYYV